jgi:ribosomal protein S18 acetylase RimI-like enzyme
VEIRAAILDDAERLVRLHIETWQTAYRGIVPDERLDALSLEQFTERWRNNLTASDPTRTNLLAVDAAELLGFVSVGPSRDENTDDTVGEVYGLYVHPSAWQSGVGRALMADAVEWLIEQGFYAATLWTWEKNGRARRFYEGIGFSHDGTTVLSDRFGAPLVEVRYRRDLTTM